MYVGFFRQEGGGIVLYYIISLLISVGVEIILYILYKWLNRK